jgi:hypothetical protein
MVFLFFFAIFIHFAFAKIDLHEKLFLTEEAVDGSYIVLLKDDVSSLSTIPEYNDGYMTFRYDAVLNGYALKGVPDSVMKGILESSLVEAVYEDGAVYSIWPFEEEMTDEATQPASEIWGLDR